MSIFTIKELKIDEDTNGAQGVQAISFVDRPAIETDFEYFAVQRNSLPYFKYAGPKDNKNRNFCSDRVGKVFHISEINSWKPTQDDAPTGTPFFATFNNSGGIDYQGVQNFRCDSEMFGCRHTLVRVSRTSDVPNNKRWFEPNIQFTEQHFVKMELLSEPKREVQGLVLKSNQMIFRNDVDGSGNPGYVYFSKDTVKKLQEKYGFNRSISFQHRDDITGQAILMDSWLVETESETQWFIKYKIVGDKLWEMIKNNTVKGFSIEALFALD